MYYTVFSRNRNKAGKLIGSLFYEGVSKSSAIDEFTTAAAGTFSITSLAGSLYFAGFQSDLPFVKELIDPSADITVTERINIILRNISLATCLNTLSVSGYKPAKLIEVHECEECDSKDATVEQNVYKEYLCSNCWANYWKSRKSLAEYVVGLAKGTYKISSFSDDDKQVLVDAWTTDELDSNGKIVGAKNRDRLLGSGYTEKELVAIEEASGLF